MTPLSASSVESDRSPRQRSRPAIWLACQILAAIAGAAILAPPFGYLGSTADGALRSVDTAIGSRTIIGIGAGAVIGAMLGCGLLNGFIGPVVIWTVGLSVLLATLGPACDACPVSSALMGAALGLFLGLTTWRGLAILLIAILGMNIAGPNGFWLAVIPGVYMICRYLRSRSLSAETAQPTDGFEPADAAKRAE